MSRTPLFAQTLRLPVIAAPMFILSRPELVIAQCLAGVVGSFPALNARPPEQLEDWLDRIGQALDAARKADPARVVAPFAVNQIVHPTNSRLEQDMETCIRHRVPLIITSLHAPGAIVPKVHAYGGKVLHDVISVRHAEKALEAGVDGLILVCAGAGGHAGTLSPFALLGEIRRFYDGPIALAGAISRGEDILAARYSCSSRWTMAATSGVSRMLPTPWPAPQISRQALASFFVKLSPPASGAGSASGSRPAARTLAFR